MQKLRRRVALFATILVTALAVTGAASSADGIGSWRFCTNCVENGGDLSRYGYVGLNAWYQDRVAPLKAANPRLEALVYKDMASTRSYSCGGLVPAGIDYCWANTSHPDWFTLDSGGQRIQWSGFTGHWQMDVGTVGYQDQWATTSSPSSVRADGTESSSTTPTPTRAAISAGGACRSIRRSPPTRPRLGASSPASVRRSSLPGSSACRTSRPIRHSPAPLSGRTGSSSLPAGRVSTG